MPKGRRKSTSPRAENYTHPTAESPMRPDVGTQAQFRKRKPPATYRYDSSLSPALEWDGQNPAREAGEALLAELERRVATLRSRIAEIPSPAGKGAMGEGNLQPELLAELQAAEETLRKLKGLSKPFLDWAGKAERLSFDVSTLPLFIHERLSTKAIIETLKGHKRDKNLELFADPQHSVADQVLRAYEHRDRWVNRLILGDSLVVMNSLLHYENLGGQVQTINMDPPYGVKFGSNFQPFVRRKSDGSNARDVRHNEDDDFTREPEMVQAYRDTWELGLHSYLTYMRDRLLLARDLLTPSGSIFVQISDENLHHVREVMDEVFGGENCVSVIPFSKTSGATPKYIASVSDFLLWYAKDRERTKYRELFEGKPPIENPFERYICVETPTGEIIDLSVAQKLGKDPMPNGRLLSLRPTDSQGDSADSKTPVRYEGKPYYPPPGRHWTVTAAGTQRAVDVGRTFAVGKTLRWKFYKDEFPYRGITNNWTDFAISGFGEEKLYVVQTLPAVVQRCLLMTTDPGDLVLDPTCGSGTTAYVAEQWGRRWITIDTSRVPLALARQRLLTATFPWHELKEEARGPVGGFVYKRKQNAKGEEVGGIVPHVTLKSIANNEPPGEEVLVDRPEQVSGITRVSGPFTVEATIPTPAEMEEAAGASQPTTERPDGRTTSGPVPTDDRGAFIDRMLEVLRKSPVLRLEGNKTVTFQNVRSPAKTLSLNAEALVKNGGEKPASAEAAVGKPVAFVFGPENGAVVERLVFEAAKEAHGKGYSHLYVIGFAIQPNARSLIEKCDDVVGLSATYVQATPDLLMGDLLKNMRSSQIFSVCGLPEVKVHPKTAKGEPTQYQVELLGLDVFDPITMKIEHRAGDDVPAWFLDTDYNGLCFHVCQAFFPRTGAWEGLKRALRTEYEEGVWDHLSGTKSAPFEAGKHGQVAVKVIDDRGNELLVVKDLKETRS